MASRCAGSVALLGVNMTSLTQMQAQKTVRQQDEKPQQEAKSDDVQIPVTWQLTKQQKEFIELFSTDDHLKQ